MTQKENSCEHDCLICEKCGSDLATFIDEEKEEAIRIGREEGELLFISELMNRNKTPHWISIIPKEMIITAEKMFSFVEECSKIREEKARAEALEEAINYLKSYPCCFPHKIFVELESLKSKGGI